jgi:DNA gyrase subunit A
VADTHDSLLFFTNRGKVFRLKCYDIPAGTSRTTKGTALINLFPIAENERVADVVSVPVSISGATLLLMTDRGEIKKTALESFAAVRSSGLIAMDVEPGDELVAVRLATDLDDVILVTQKGLAIRFLVARLRTSLRTSGGVRGIRLHAGDRVVAADIADPNGFFLVVTTNGFGKLTPITRYPRQNRAGSGLKTFRITDKTGDLAAARVVSLSKQVMIISAEGNIIHTPVKERDPKKGITIQGRSTQGVRLMRLDKGDRVVAITSFDRGDRVGREERSPGQLGLSFLKSQQKGGD